MASVPAVWPAGRALGSRGSTDLHLDGPFQQATQYASAIKSKSPELYTYNMYIAHALPAHIIQVPARASGPSGRRVSPAILRGERQHNPQNASI